MNKSDYPIFIKDQPIMSTHIDSQGEKRNKEFLEKIINETPVIYPIGQEHDMSQEIIGLMENLRLVAIVGEDNEWQVIADIYLKSNADLANAVKGFSYSLTESYKSNSEKPIGCIYYPFPYYNDEIFVDRVLDVDIDLSFGKWIKKASDPGSTALIVSFVLFIIAPVWKKIYDEKVYPFILSVIEKCKELEHDEIKYDYGQVINDQHGRKVNLYFIPDKTKNYDTLHPNLVKEGIEMCFDFLQRDHDAINKGVSLIKLYYHNISSGYIIFYVQFADGTFKNYA